MQVPARADDSKTDGLTITPVLLCGGSGTRLWPLSRKSAPKQFSSLTGETSLFQASVMRMKDQGFAAPLIVTNADFRFVVAEQLAKTGTDPSAILIEPEGRNTAPAVLAAALWLENTDPEMLMLVAPTDHVIPDAAAFRAAVRIGATAAANGKLVTFGITPTRAESGYGYLELGEAPDVTSERTVDLVRFVEKPAPARARKMLRTGNYLWNAGIFLFTPKTILAAYRKHAAQLIAPVQAAVEQSRTDLRFQRLAHKSWCEIDPVSIDFAVMEHAENIVVVPFSGGWSDLGDWQSVWRESAKDDRGVAVSGPAMALDCDNTLLRSEDDAVEIVGIGLRNIVAVAMRDAVLVTDTSQAQNVKTAVSELKKRRARQAVSFSRDHRPWGWFESLATGERFQVKRIVVHPGAALSLQSHQHRAEHWVVVEGTAKVTVDGKVTTVQENQSVYVPRGAVHRLENPGNAPMVLIEIQTGSYLGEDDITRYEDNYARADG